MPSAPRGRRKLLVTGVGHARPDHVAILPGNTALPLTLAAAIEVFVLLVLAQLCALTPIPMAVVAALIRVWGRGMVRGVRSASVAVTPGLALPEQGQRPRTLGWSASVALLVADGALSASLVFGVGLLALVAPDRPGLAAVAGMAALSWIGLAVLGPVAAPSAVRAPGRGMPRRRGSPCSWRCAAAGHGRATVTLRLRMGWPPGRRAPAPGSGWGRRW